MSLHADDDKLWEKYKSIWAKIEELKKRLNWMFYDFMVNLNHVFKF